MLQEQMQMCNVRWDRYFHISVLNMMLETTMQVGIKNNTTYDGIEFSYGGIDVFI